MPALTTAEVDEMLEELEEEGLLRHNRFLLKSLGSVSYTLWQPQNTRSNSMIPGILNILRKLLWLPMFIAGIYIWLNHTYHCYGGSIVTGYLCGMILGMAVHETSHAMSCLHRGGRLFEVGCSLSFFVIPGMYVLIDISKKRMYRFETLVAGVEGNFLLSGLFLIFSVCVEEFAQSFEAAGLCNLAMGLINLLPVAGLDGMRALCCLLASEEAPAQASAVLCDQGRRQALRREGLAGCVELLTCFCLTAMRYILPILLFAVSVWEVFSLCSYF